MRLYKQLLLLYPASFRHHYGAEMALLFARRRRDTHGIAVLFLWLGTIADVFVGAARVHLDLLRQDAGYAIRTWRRTPAFTVTILLVTTLGVGATTAVFTLSDFVLIRPLPFAVPTTSRPGISSPGKP